MNSKKILLKWSLIGLFGLIIFVFFYFEGHKILTFEFLKSNHSAIKMWTEQNILLSAIVFFLIYVLSTALSLPGAAILTLASGGLFGLSLGTLISSFASSIGAGFAFLGARYFLKDWVQSKFKSSFEKINEGINKEGAYYLFTLRLTPVFPFFLVNLIMGLTSMKFWTYFFVSQIAMLPGTLIYVNAGTQIASLTSTKDILSAKIILSFVLLGAFPLIVKKLIVIKNKNSKKLNY